MEISFIATVLNEEENIDSLLHSLLFQTYKADEIIIVDGGSTDSTLSVISNFQMPRLSSKRAPSFAPISNKKTKIKILTKKGNRSVGRNEAIRQAKGDIIVCSDAGCILDKDWVKNIIYPFADRNVGVVAGYYKGYSKTTFQECLTPYVLVMEDRVDPEGFLPASRSMAFRKSVWEKVKGFNEKYSYNEDYIFANKLKEKKIKIYFQPTAIVYWLPRKDFKEAFLMFFKFALGDMEAGILRKKVIFLFLRYILGLIFLSVFVITKSILILSTLFIIIVFYILWSILKNYHYVNNLKAFVILPLLQLTSDLAVIMGSIVGFFSFVR